MINICMYCNPNYNREKRIQTIYRDLDIVSQFIILYKSIKKNWKSFDYDITLFYNKNIKWNEEDLEKINGLDDIQIIGVEESDHPKFPWMIKHHCFGHELKRKGTHRLVLDCDMLALKEPIFDLSCDWQAMFAGSANEKVLNFIYNETKFEKIPDKIKDNLFINYINNNINHKNLFPHFNGGAFLVKEQFCRSLSLEYKKLYEYVLLSKDKYIRHISIQYLISLYLFNMLHNWKPFEPGFNYLLKVYDVDKFGKNNISLIHYCGVGALEICKRKFPEYFE